LDPCLLLLLNLDSIPDPDPIPSPIPDPDPADPADPEDPEEGRLNNKSLAYPAATSWCRVVRYHVTRRAEAKTAIQIRTSLLERRGRGP